MNVERIVFLIFAPGIAAVSFVLALGFAGVRLNIASNSLPQGFTASFPQRAAMIFSSALPESQKRSQSKESIG
jgi:hypothetical protein